MTVLVLIIFFAALIIYQISNYTIIEGATTQFQDYSEDTLILSKQNAGNIQVLKGRLDSLSGLDAKIEKTNAAVAQLQDKVKGLYDAMTSSAMKDIPVVGDIENL
jgi:hypothetical protein